MKLLKAFIRTSKVDEVIRALEEAGAPGITVSRVHGLGYGYEPMLFTLAPSEIRKTPEIAKIEVVCADEHLDRLLEVLVTTARTGDLQARDLVTPEGKAKLRALNSEVDHLVEVLRLEEAARFGLRGPAAGDSSEENLQ